MAAFFHWFGEMLWESPLRLARDLSARSFGGPACVAFDRDSAPAWLAGTGLPPSLQTLQVANFITINSALALLYALAERWPRKPLGASSKASPPPPPHPVTALDRALSWCAAATFLAKLGYGVLGRKGVSLCNPCHVLNLAQWLALRRRGPATSRAMLLFLPWVCGATVAMLAPDPEDEFAGELAQFWAEHTLIAVVLPLYFIVRDGGAAANPSGLLGELHRDPLAFVRGTIYYYAQSLVVLMVLARVTTVNTNYMLCPPAVLESLLAPQHLRHYMVIWYGVAFPVALLMSWHLVLWGKLLLWIRPTLFQPARAAAIEVAAAGKKGK